MTDDRFEHELRSFLVARAPRGATTVLRARVAAVPSEATVAPSRWRSRSMEVWRLAASFGAAAVVAVVVFAALSRTGDPTVRDPDTVGRSSNAPVVGGAPFVAAPTGFFTPQALTAAEERLRRVFVETGIEATFIVTPAPSLQELSTPGGWRDGRDRDHDPRRDVTAVAGVTPDHTIVCCVTITGATIEQARQNLYWQPIDQPSALDDELAAATSAERDEALRGFVRGIEDLATGITELGVEPHPSDVLMRLMPLILLCSILGLVVAVVPRPRRSTVASDGQRGLAAETEIPVPLVEEIGGPWPPSKRLLTAERTPVLVALAAFGGIAAMTLVDGLRAPDRTVSLDPIRETVGIAQRGGPIVPAILASIAMVALIIYALRGGWRRRIGIAAALVLICGSAWVAVDMTKPAGREVDIFWVASKNGRVTSHQSDGIRELVTFDVSPGETFAMAGVVRNTGVLPLTILGLDGVRSTTGNPYVASIIGLGWIPQPTDTGRVQMLVAAPEAASAGWPVTVGPGEELAVLIVGRAGECAEPRGAGPGLPLFRFPMRYRVLGFEQATDVSAPADMFVAAKDVCTVALPGGTITYGPVP